MTPFAWICQPSMIGNMVKKVIRWATGDDVEDYPDNSVDGHKCTLVELFDGDGVHREVHGQPIYRRWQGTDDETTEWEWSRRPKTTDGTDMTVATGTNNLKRDNDQQNFHEQITQLEDRLESYRDELVTLNMENARLKTVGDQKMNDKFDILHEAVTKLNNRMTNLVEPLERRIEVFEKKSANDWIVSTLREKLDTKLNNLESNIVNRLNLMEAQMVIIENQSAKDSDLLNVHESIHKALLSTVKSYSKLSSYIDDKFNLIETKMAVIESKVERWSQHNELDAVGGVTHGEQSEVVQNNTIYDHDVSPFIRAQIVDQLSMWNGILLIAAPCIVALSFSVCSTRF